MAAMTKLYAYPPSVNGGAVDPTAAQMAQHDRLVVTLTTNAGTLEDDTAVAHNMNVPTATATDGSPEVIITSLANGSVLTALNVVFTDANTVTFQKAAKGANTSATFRVVIRRPCSVGK